jgi:DNA-binding Xre family transcriptional regulator
MEMVNKIDEVMADKKVSIEDLIDRTSLPRMTIYNARKGRNITITTALKIAEALGTSVEDLWIKAEFAEKDEEEEAENLSAA